jgi:hypothetical protein
VRGIIQEDSSCLIWAGIKFSAEILRLALRSIQPLVLEMMLPERETNFHLQSGIRMHGINFYVSNATLCRVI